MSDVTNTTATLSWAPPEHTGGRNITEIYYTVTIISTYFKSFTSCYTLHVTRMNVYCLYTAPSPKVPDLVVTGLRTTQIALTGLIPFLNYTFLVTSENKLSHNDTNVKARTSNTTATTLEGGMYCH